MILKEDAFQISNDSDVITIKKLKLEQGAKKYSVEETNTPKFNQLRSKVVKLVPKTKDSDLMKKSEISPPATGRMIKRREWENSA